MFTGTLVDSLIATVVRAEASPVRYNVWLTYLGMPSQCAIDCTEEQATEWIEQVVEEIDYNPDTYRFMIEPFVFGEQSMAHAQGLS